MAEKKNEVVLSGNNAVSEDLKRDVDLENQLTNPAKKNPRGIPSVVFIEDVESFVSELGIAVETGVGAFNQLHQKYKVIEQTKLRLKANYKTKIPEIEKTAGIIRCLIEKQEAGEELKTTYSLADTVYAHAKGQCNGKVNLWLGANVMVEYTYDEALDLLNRNLENAKQKMEDTREDLEFLQSQIITVEVNMARLINYNVKQKQVAALTKLKVDGQIENKS
mmetsp:Transcript_28166/g.36903  ORF Transcript_28166/g.36903 Transcript_28166/m.36903 type:complete len:221 (+) Transcript_28166:97-759(+)|eukprot:CAMPEP_0117739024 /NCGR_PEP_ID=MMETSP0947-20121206/3491_1 /TAXON_ID=44440 /ORGANISM="Chattonella subsalsa, Strain CCMP2191" /LENGTH=220 /DNA_ID=CAMNT_0005554851 /DNA_START=84 /DNA_END=746 /DNA_ORIENTATION=-